MRVTAVFSTAIFAAAVLGAPFTQLRKRENERTDNWAGAVVKSPAADQGGFVTVIGSFVVPGAMEGDTRPSGVSMWVGIDGYTAPPSDRPVAVVIQAGVDAILDNEGEVTYRTWVEWFPNPSIYIDEGDFGVLAGDTVTVQVATKAGDTTATALFTSSNGDRNTTRFSTPDAGQSALGENMEWIVERLQQEGQPPEDNLLNFGAIQITGCSGSTQTVAGGVGPSQGVGVDMFNSAGGIAATAAIDETTVTVTWQTG